MTLTEINSLQSRIETMLTDQWEAMPEPKPTYTEWFYGDNGPRDAIDQLLNEMRDEVIKRTYVPGCIKAKNQFFRPVAVCEGCEKKGSCIPYKDTMERIDQVAA